MIPDLPILDVPLTKRRGACKPCLWCGHRYGRFLPKRDGDPDFHAARVICDGCNRQIAWASARQVRQAAAVKASNTISERQISHVATPL